jgi:hypothetical protein
VPVYRGSGFPTVLLRDGLRPGEVFSVRPRMALDRPLPNSAAALGLGPPPPPGSGRLARRLGLGLFGTLASMIWMWSLTPPPL